MWVVARETFTQLSLTILQEIYIIEGRNGMSPLNVLTILVSGSPSFATPLAGGGELLRVVFSFMLSLPFILWATWRHIVWVTLLEARSLVC